MADVIILVGPPGAGKGTQGKRLALRLGGIHLSSGEVLRTHGTDEILAIMDRGELVPDELFESVVDPILAQAPSDKPLILDGFVRLLSDEAWLEQRLQNMGRKIDWVIFIDVDEATTAKRLMLRHRDDDAAGALEERWVEYRRETLPVIESMKSHFRFMAVDGTKSIEEVDAQIMEQGL